MTTVNKGSPQSLEINRQTLYGKLNSLLFGALESAFTLCKLRGNPYVELIHWLNQLLQSSNSDFHRVISRFELNVSALAEDLTTGLDNLPRGSTTIVDISEHIDTLTERAWVVASLMFGASRIRSGHLLIALLRTPSLRRILFNISAQFERIRLEELTSEFAKITGGSAEDALDSQKDVGGGAAPGEASGAVSPTLPGKHDALARFSVDLTERARKGELDPVRGRDDEIRQIIDILMRRRQNNPILTGEAGVGKTAVVEGFAHRIATGDVPPPLKHVTLRSLDLGLLQAGASMKGEFEQRLRNVIEEVQLSKEKPVILFIDEAHTLIGAGGREGAGDAANLLKPALARGTLRTIAATTWAEYKKYIEKDPALTRRFQVVKVGEPDDARCALMLRGMVSVQEKDHKVQILDEAVEAAIRLSRRYIADRQLPDKAVSLLDTACARIAIGHHAAPAQVEHSRRAIETMKIELGILDRESVVGIDHQARRAELDVQIKQESENLAKLEQRWNGERDLVQKILQTRSALRETSDGKVDSEKPSNGNGTAPAAEPASAKATPVAATQAPPSRETLLAELKTHQSELQQLQGESPLVLPSVDAQVVANVVADWTGIPVGRMVRNEIEAVLKLADSLEHRVIGQRHALEIIGDGIQTSRAGLGNPDKPIGVFLLAGTSGVGKTETALALAEALYGGEHNAVIMNMSEFQESHTVSKLLGSPPGYVDSDQGGQLTEAVRRRPHSVLLLDEIEKAHPDVHEIFYQIFQRGWVEDSRGLGVDFKNTIILLTSNVGSDLMMDMCRNPEQLPTTKELADAIRDPLRKVFAAAFLGRLTVVPYYPISPAILRNIIDLQLKRVADRLRKSQKVPLEYDQAVVDLIAARCTEGESGARAVDAIISHGMLPRISKEFLTRLAGGREISKVQVSASDGQFSYVIE